MKVVRSQEHRSYRQNGNGLSSHEEVWLPIIGFVAVAALVLVLVVLVLA